MRLTRDSFPLCKHVWLLWKCKYLRVSYCRLYSSLSTIFRCFTLLLRFVTAPFFSVCIDREKKCDVWILFSKISASYEPTPKCLDAMRCYGVQCVRANNRDSCVTHSRERKTTKKKKKTKKKSQRVSKPSWNRESKQKSYLNKMQTKRWVALWSEREHKLRSIGIFR